jgi:hypothetical protein
MTPSMKYCVVIGIAVSVSLILSACSSGGSSSSSQPQAVTSRATVSGIVVGSAAVTASQSSAITDGVSIQIVSFDKSGKELGRAPVTSDSVGSFSAQLNLTSAGGYLVVSASKDGFTEFNKRIDYQTPGNIELQATLQSLNVAFATPGSALTSGIGKSSEPSFNFAVLKLPDGSKKALAGSAIKAAKAAGAIVETSINIPAASVPGVSKLKGELNAYDPATQSDRFPGSYTGTDAKGNEGRMVSLAFDYLKISDADTGKSLGTLAKELLKAGITKAADASTVITRYIYSSSCANLFLEDYDTTTAGWQVPVWSLNPNTGKWILLGVGTIVDGSGAVISSPTAADCANGTYYLKIAVTNSEFTNSWWNLDHILFDTPKEACLSGQFAFSNGDPLKNLCLTLSGSNIDYNWGVTGNDGSFKISAMLLNKNAASRSATLGYYDESGSYASTAVTLGDAPNCGTFNRTNIAKPCEVSGKLVDSTGNGVAYRSLRLQGDDFYRSVGTTSDGTFSSLVKCGTAITAYVGSQETSANTFTVNGTADTIETSDDGAKAVLANLTAPNTAPGGYLYFATRSIKAGQTLNATLSAYDEDGDYPIAWTLNLKSGTTVAATKTGSTDASSGQTSVAVTGLAAGNYAAELVLTDQKGVSRTLSADQVTVSDGSRPPVVSAYADRTYVNSCGTGNSITLYGSAYSPEGDAMTGAWTVNGASLSNCLTGTDGPGYLTSTCTSVAVPAAASTTYTYTVTDPTSGKNGKRDITVNTYAAAPWITSLTATPTLVEVGATGAARNVALSAVGTNNDGVSMTASWSVNGAAIAACPNASLASGATANCTFAIPSTAAKGDSFTFTFTVAACGKSASRETRATYGKASDVTIIIQ